MNFKTTTICLALTIIFPAIVLAGYGDSFDQNSPTYRERAAMMWINIARQAPQYYVSLMDTNASSILSGKYDVNGYTGTFKSVQPLYMNAILVDVAKDHSAAMSSDNCFKQQCNDGPVESRVAQAHYNYNTVAQTIGASTGGVSDLFDPKTQVDNWICSKPQGQDTCSSDSSTDFQAIGPRIFIMDPTFQENGVGWNPGETNGQYKQLYTGVFAVPSGRKPPTNPIVSGSHHISNGNEFFATYYQSNKAPKFAYIVYKGERQSMDKVADGVYKFLSSTIPSTCEDYYFMFADEDENVFRFPESDNLHTFSLLSSSGCQTAAGNDSACGNVTCDKGTCYLGDCICIEGWSGDTCSKSNDSSSSESSSASNDTSSSSSSVSESLLDESANTSSSSCNGELSCPCSADSDCNEDLICTLGHCIEPASSSSCVEGTLGCACRSNSTCDEGFECGAFNVCIESNSTSSSSSSVDDSPQNVQKPTSISSANKNWHFTNTLLIVAAWLFLTDRI